MSVPMPFGNEFACVVEVFVLSIVPLSAPSKYMPVAKLLQLQFLMVVLNWSV